jgi:hypothetical protein
VKHVLAPDGLAAAVAAAVLLFHPAAWGAHVLHVAHDTDSVALGARFDARVKLDRVYDNPFDPAQVQVDAMIVTPSGTVHRLPAFWDRETSRALIAGREVITASGDGFFHVRYAPLEVGRHELTIVARDATGEEVTGATVFQVTEGDARGFIHVDPSDPMALAYDDGTSYVPVGANVDWSSDSSAGYDLERYLAELGVAGATWTRLWMTHFGEGWTIEWGQSHPSGYYAGLGRYSVEVASRLDRVFEAAEARGIAIQLVLWQHSQFEAENWSSWADNPYNAVNGGPAVDSRAFFESPVAIELSQRRIRYLIGRYAAYRSLLAWEIMNEMDGVKAPFSTVSGWCEARAREIHDADPYRHPVTTSYMVRPYLALPQAYASDAYDITQAHAYGGAFAFGIPKDASVLREMGKPAIFGEFGLDYLGEVELTDPVGVHLAEGSWMALASGFWGGAMSWWWDTYLRPNDLWSTQQGIAAFVRVEDLRGMHEPLPAEVVAEDASGQALDVFGRLGEGGAMMYIRHPEARWEVAASADVPDVAGGTARVVCPARRPCKVVAYDTSTGQRLGGPALIRGGEAGYADVSLPAFHGSVAMVVRSVEEEPMVREATGGGCATRGGASRRAGRGWFALLVAIAVVVRARRFPRTLAGGCRSSSSTP